MRVSKGKMTQLRVLMAVGLVIVIVALIGPYIAPNDPSAQDYANILSEPSDQYPLGTDQIGRCIYSRILTGARISLGMTFLLLVMIFVLGIAIGTAAAIYGDPLDTIIMRAADTVMAFPDIVFAIAIIGILGPGMVNTLMALAVIWWVKYAKLTRILVLDVLNETYIDAAIMSGAGKWKIIVKYIWPNIASQLVIQLSMDVGNMMLSLAGLSFLGLGVQPPTPEWGNMLKEGRIHMQTTPGLLIYPGLAIFMIVAFFNLLGDVVRDVLDPKEA